VQRTTLKAVTFYNVACVFHSDSRYIQRQIPFIRLTFYI